jgi:hypothetical protein
MYQSTRGGRGDSVNRPGVASVIDWMHSPWPLRLKPQRVWSVRVPHGEIFAMIVGSARNNLVILNLAQVDQAGGYFNCPSRKPIPKPPSQTPHSGQTSSAHQHNLQSLAHQGTPLKR